MKFTLMLLLLAFLNLSCPSLCKERTVYYATDRMGGRGEPTLTGTSKCKDCHRRQPFYGPYRRQQLVYGSAKVLSTHPSSFSVKSSNSLDIDSNATVLVFVHGFNCKFVHALEIAQKLADDLENRNSENIARPVIPVIFSWPSMGSKFAYMQDECSSEWSYSDFRLFMDELRSRINDPRRLIIVAHSMGSRLVHRYLLEQEFLSQKNSLLKTSDGTGITSVARAVVLSSPDIDYQTACESKARELLSSSVIDNAYILISDIDSPLELSRSLHGYTRLGRPALPSATSVFWGTFRTGSLANIFSTLAHSPALLVQRGVRQVTAGFRSPDEIWIEQNLSKAIPFAPRVKLIDFTIQDRLRRSTGHSICTDLISGLISDGTNAFDCDDTIKSPDVYRECMLFPFKCIDPYAEEKPPVFAVKRIKRIH